CYDWANSAFTTLVATFIYSTFFTKAMAPDEMTGTLWWSRAVALSSLLSAALAPVLGAAADRAGAQKRFLGLSTGICVAATAALAFVAPGRLDAALLALTLYVIADVAFELGYVFYNAFLPVIASPERIGRVSGYGWGLGYLGGLVCMVAALVGFVQPATPWFGLSTQDGFNVRATNLLVAAWFVVFALPLFLMVPERRLAAVRVDARAAFGELAKTFREIRRYKQMVTFLIARLIYNDGLVTIFVFGGIYAAGTFGMPLSEVIVFGIALNVAAGLGSLTFGWVDDRVGGKLTILATLVALTAGTLLAALAPNKTWLWVAGVVIGTFVGPNQSASRSLMGRLVPEGRQAEFFGFFAFSGRVTSFLGPIALGWVSAAAGTQRAGVATLLAFFLVGGLILMAVDERAGIQAARAG
ncbi:MAG: MFS transporter, partial [Candidatus Rokuibacteriota bacterium]